MRRRLAALALAALLLSLSLPLGALAQNGAGWTGEYPALGAVWEVSFDDEVYLVRQGGAIDVLPQPPAGRAWFLGDALVVAPFAPDGDVSIVSRPYDAAYPLRLGETAFAVVWGAASQTGDAHLESARLKAPQGEKVLEAYFVQPRDVSKVCLFVTDEVHVYTINDSGSVLKDLGRFQAGEKAEIPLNGAAGYALTRDLPKTQRQSLSAPDGSVIVTGELPVGAKLAVSMVVALPADRPSNTLQTLGGTTDTAQSASAVSDIDHTLFAMDIALADGMELTAPATVTFQDESLVSAIVEQIKAGYNVKILHDHEGNMEEISIDVTGNDADGYSVSFTTDSFSTFSAVWDDQTGAWHDTLGFINGEAAAVPSRADVKLSLSGVMPRTAEAAAQDVTAQYGGEGGLYAFDISLMNQNVEIQPVRGAIDVRVTAPDISEEKNLAVYQIDESGERVLVEGAAVSGNTIAWSAESISVYAIVDITMALTPEGYWTLRPGASLSGYDAVDGENGESVAITDASVFKIVSQDGDWTEIKIDGQTKFVHSEELYSLRAVETDENRIQKMRRAAIKSTKTEAVADGEAIELTAVLDGFDDVEYEIVWEADKGNGWEEAGRGESFTYTADAYSMTWKFRIRVDYTK